MDQVFIRNRCAQECIDPRFMPLVEAARDGMLACCGTCVRELRLQGSIARGDARPGLADLDMVALLNGPSTDGQIRCLAELAELLGARTNLVSRFDLEAVDGTALERFRRFVLSSDSLCIHGADSMTLPVQSMDRLALAQLVTPDPAAMLPDYLEWAKELAGAEDAERRFASRIIGKDLLKVLRGALLVRGAPYEVAIPPLASQCQQSYPQASDVAARLCSLYTDPTTDLTAIRVAVHGVIKLVRRSPEFALLRGEEDGDVTPPGKTM